MESTHSDRMLSELNVVEGELRGECEKRGNVMCSGGTAR